MSIEAHAVKVQPIGMSHSYDALSKFDENARVNLELWERCAARETEKAEAVARARANSR